jgi:sortase A
VRVRAEHFFWLAGFLCLGVAGAAIVESRVYQFLESSAFDRARDSRTGAEAPRVSGEQTGPASRPARGVLGRIEIPRLGIRAMVREGMDDETLKVAVGHIPGTARPGERGNIGLAGHRDTFFRALRGVRKGDLMRLTTLDGSETYRVASASVVDPDRVDLLANAKGMNALTLVTCFPFDWIGAAPKRFVVAALPAGDVQRGRSQGERNSSAIGGR